MEYCVVKLVPEIIKTFKEHQYGETGDKNPYPEGGEFLIGIGSRLFKIYSDFQVEESIDNYNSCGCGEYHANGSLYSTKEEHLGARMVKAIKAAEYHSAGVQVNGNVQWLYSDPINSVAKKKKVTKTKKKAKV